MRIHHLTLVISCGVLASCKVPGPLRPTSESPSIVRRKVSISGGIVEPGETLSFTQAALLALRHSPRLRSFDAAKREADGNILQASLKPNPTLDTQIENILGSGPNRGFDAAESTLAISQLIERGGKREARQAVKEADKAVVISAYEITRREIFTEVGQAYAQALAAQEKATLYGDLVKLNESFLPEIDKRIEAGKVTAVEKVRAKTAVSTARLAQQQAQREFHTACLRIAGTWGSTNVTFKSLVGKLGDPTTSAGRSALETRLLSHPEYRKETKEMEKAEAEHRLALTKGVSDVTIQGGVRHFSENDGDVAVVVGFSIPLPLNDKNQGEIAATAAGVEVARKERSAALNGLQVKLGSSLKELEDTRKEIETIKAELLPGAQEAFDGVQDGYSKGRFGYLDLIEARRSLTEAKVQLLDASAAYQQSVAEISGLTASMPGESSK